MRQNIQSPGSLNQVPASIECTNLLTGAVSSEAILFNYQQWSGCWVGPRMWIGSQADAPQYHGNYCTDCIVTWKCDDGTVGVYQTRGSGSNSAAFWLKFDE